MSEFVLPVRVYIEDTDAGGIVYYVNYLKFMERARTELLRSYGYDKPAFWADNLMFVVHSVQVNYRSPAQLDDELQVSAVIEKVGRTYFDVAQQVRRGDTVLCEGVVRVANVTRDGMKPKALPTDMRQQLTG
ncbi:tol-pal system-associated acyl-CoA thioesterase [Porticoccus sp. W117]|uniref:tol-pal system-associated acyl-CoA thioesterase n=1 Tax=Porticoccus sp. W117 TaxID=3054777 RepID=UPI0025945DD3|nr:tol-pal system-associated acyl-CoA thioesterase [Porticoccus sp. W117]MDM3871246.1 tol-pal system-associated acyl-CoA thioesterase [Porticoccus sp. W117]